MYSSAWPSGPSIHWLSQWHKPSFPGHGRAPATAPMSSRTLSQVLLHNTQGTCDAADAQAWPSHSDIIELDWGPRLCIFSTYPKWFWRSSLKTLGSEFAMSPVGILMRQESLINFSKVQKLSKLTQHLARGITVGRIREGWGEMGKPGFCMLDCFYRLISRKGKLESCMESQCARCSETPGKSTVGVSAQHLLSSQCHVANVIIRPNELKLMQFWKSS